MKLEVGKAYKTAEGRKVIMDGTHGEGSRFIAHFEDGQRSGMVWNVDGTPWLGSTATSPIISEWDETPRVDRYDLEGITFCRSGYSPSTSFLFRRTPEGLDWWSDNQETPEAQARLEQMRCQWDEEHGVVDKDASEIIKECLTNKEWGAGVEPDRLTGWLADTTIRTRTILDDQDIHGVNVEDGEVMAGPYTTAEELRQAAAVLVQMADKLEGK